MVTVVSVCGVDIRWYVRVYKVHRNCTVRYLVACRQTHDISLCLVYQNLIGIYTLLHMARKSRKKVGRVINIEEQGYMGGTGHARVGETGGMRVGG